jgi:hypothetical protein
MLGAGTGGSSLPMLARVTRGLVNLNVMYGTSLLNYRRVEFSPPFVRKNRRVVTVSPTRPVLPPLYGSLNLFPRVTCRWHIATASLASPPRPPTNDPAPPSRRNFTSGRVEPIGQYLCYYSPMASCQCCWSSVRERKR